MIFCIIRCSLACGYFTWLQFLRHRRHWQQAAQHDECQQEAQRPLHFVSHSLTPPSFMVRQWFRTHTPHLCAILLHKHCSVQADDMLRHVLFLSLLLSLRKQAPLSCIQKTKSRLPRFPESPSVSSCRLSSLVLGSPF